LLGVEASPAKSRTLLAGLGSSVDSGEDAFRASGLLAPAERKRLENVNLQAFEHAWQQGVRILTETSYPQVLLEAEEHVLPALFVHGALDCLSYPTVGIVGTRAASAYGKACAQKFAEALASAGVTVVSGGALGIDAAAHRGALAVGGSTIAVLAGGVDHIYPAVHAALFRQIRTRGCLVSQYAIGAKPNEYKFLARNTLIAALSRALLVVQAPTRSGALSTAHAAAELGREVFVVPANIDSIEFRGSFNLIRDGATLVYHPDQVLEAIGVERKEAEPAPESSEIGTRILAVLGNSPLDAERIVDRTGLNAGEVLAELTMLELDGLVIRETSGYMRKL
jgi:DNA processing protein